MPTGDRAGITLTYARSRMKNPLLSINECEILHFGSNSLGNTLRCAVRCSGSVIPCAGLYPDSSHHRAGAVDYGCNVSGQSSSVVTLMHSTRNPMLAS